MTLNELYTNLSHGVLSNLAVGGEGSGFIPFGSQAKVCLAINKGLLALYGRFILQEKEVQIRAYDSITLYPLKKIYADQDPTVVPQKFITDTISEPFIEDVIKILDIYDDDEGRLDINDPTGLGLIYTPNSTTVQLVEPVTGDLYFILYQAKHAKVEADNLEQAIELPDVLMPALEAHIAYTIMAAMNGQEHVANAANQYAQYEMICNEIIEKDLVGTSIAGEVSKLPDRGWR